MQCYTKCNLHAAFQLKAGWNYYKYLNFYRDSRESFLGQHLFITIPNRHCCFTKK